MACCTWKSTRCMQQRELEIVNKLGLHARASAKLTQLAAKFESDVQVMRNNRKVNAKSIMGVMMLAAGKGAIVTLETSGRPIAPSRTCSRQASHSSSNRRTNPT